jgi:hypothetical protein
MLNGDISKLEGIVMPNQIDERAWVDRFMNRISRLVPHMKPADAIAHATETYAEANDLEPEEAAEIYALECPPADCGAPEPQLRDNKSRMALWAEAFADRINEIEGGKVVYHDMLDWAHKFWPANAHRHAPDVADEEWRKLHPNQ